MNMCGRCFFVSGKKKGDTSEWQTDYMKYSGCQKLYRKM